MKWRKRGREREGSGELLKSSTEARAEEGEIEAESNRLV